ncbi:MAG: NAD(P)H-dependent oxidoreductase [Myxococcales bacterium]|nr:NAD(P)H-dependent oxidoreductase [Myxococcales bacterium]
MSTLGVIVCSTRPGRVGLPIAQWFLEHAKAHGKFAVELVDLQEVALPLLDEPKHPRLGDYQHEHTKAWSRRVSALDAFVFVTPEYNYGSPPALVNALHYLYKEWNYKAAGFVSYGGLSGGTRSVQMTKQFLTTLKVMPLPEAVNVAFFNTLMENGAFRGSEPLVKSAAGMLDELHRWTEALRTLR